MIAGFRLNYVSLPCKMMKALYNLFLFFYPLGAKLLSFKNEKARKWIKGRKGIFDQLAASSLRRAARTTSASDVVQ